MQKTALGVHDFGEDAGAANVVWESQMGSFLTAKSVSEDKFPPLKHWWNIHGSFVQHPF